MFLHCQFLPSFLHQLIVAFRRLTCNTSRQDPNFWNRNQRRSCFAHPKALPVWVWYIVFFFVRKVIEKKGHLELQTKNILETSWTDTYILGPYHFLYFSYGISDLCEISFSASPFVSPLVVPYWVGCLHHPLNPNPGGGRSRWDPRRGFGRSSTLACNL